MTGARGDTADGDGDVVRVDLDGFPTTWPVRQGRWVQRFWISFAAYWLISFVLRLIWGEGTDVLMVVLGAVMVVLSVGNVALLRSQRVQLEPEGYRVRDAVFKGRLRPWSSVDQVRAGNARWGTRAEIRGRAGSPASVELHGMGEEQAVELQRRVAEAQAAAAGDGAAAAEERA